MADTREYFSQPMDAGSIQISEDVVASVAAAAVLEVEGIRGLSANFGSDIAELLGKKNVSKGIRVSGKKEEGIVISCDVVANFGAVVFEVAKNVQEAVKSAVESVTGIPVKLVDVNVCSVALPREIKK